MPPTRRVLLTGFEPFEGRARNPSIEAVRLVDGGWNRSETLVVAELPVAYTRAGRRLDDLLTEHDPDVVVGVGLAARRDRIGLERLAVNLCDARIPDNDGAQPDDGAVLAGGPLAIRTSLPVKATLARLLAEGIPAELSLSAGTYVCNAVFYRCVTWASAGPGRRAGFVHVPPTEVLPLAATARAVRLAVEAALDVDTDARVPVGATE